MEDGLTWDLVEVERVLLDLLRCRGEGKTICPSEVARLMDAEDWRDGMESVREVARQLEEKGKVEFLQRGERVDPGSAKGPIRLRMSPGPNHA